MSNSYEKVEIETDDSGTLTFETYRNATKAELLVTVDAGAPVEIDATDDGGSQTLLTLIGMLTRLHDAADPHRHTRNAEVGRELGERFSAASPPLTRTAPGA